jgi:hypothetical protein
MTSPAFTTGHAAFHPRPGPPESSPVSKHHQNVDETIRDLRATIAALELRITELLLQLSQANQTIEDVACGTRLDCPRCGKVRPCLCQDS